MREKTSTAEESRKEDERGKEENKPYKSPPADDDDADDAEDRGSHVRESGQVTAIAREAERKTDDEVKKSSKRFKNKEKETTAPEYPNHK